MIFEYEYPDCYKQQQIFKTCLAHSDKEAALKIGISLYLLKKYCYKNKYNDVIYDGIFGYIDSGDIIFKYNRHDLIRKKIPINELFKTITDIEMDNNQKQHEINELIEFIQKEWHEDLKKQFDKGDGKLVYNTEYDKRCENITIVISRLKFLSKNIK